MRNYREIEKVINDMVLELKRIANSQVYSYHHSTEYQVKAVEKAHKDIDYYIKEKYLTD